MKEEFKSKITTGMLFVIMVLSIFFSTNGFAANAVEAKTVTEDIGVFYRGHVQNQGNMPKPEGSMVVGPEALGTRGKSLRVEGFWIDLTGVVPEEANIVYEVHVQNEGWMTPVKNGNFAGTAGESQRVESIKIRLENLPGYDVYYRGHVQNVGDTPMVDGEWCWKKNGEELGTTGSSQRLEELQVKIVKQPDTTTNYDKAGTYGPKTGVEVIKNDVVINTPDVVLQNLHIEGNLTIGEGVGEGDVTLNNITVDGETFIRGGGKNSIHINGGSYNKVTIQQTSSGQVRIVATDTAGLEVVISEDAKGEDIILEGAFENVQIDAPDVKISTQGDTTIKQMVVAEAAKGSQITLDKETTVNNIDLNASVDMKGEGTIEKANVNSDNITFEQKPIEETVAPEVKVPPVVTPPVPVKPEPTPSPSGPSADDLLVAKFNNIKSTSAMVDLLMVNRQRLDLTGFDELKDYYEQLIVGECLLEKDNFINMTAVQKATTEGIKRAKEDAQAKAYIQALFEYTPQIRFNDYNVLILTYSNALSSTQKSLLSGLYADLVLKLDTPLTEGEAFDLTIGKTTKRITSKEMPGKEILLSKLMGRKLGNADLVENLNTSQSISVNDISMKAEQYLAIYPCTTRNGDEYFKNFREAHGVNITPFWLKAYANALSLDYQNSQFLINYGGGFTAAETEQLKQYYGENRIHLYRALETGESITITVMDKDYVIDSTTVMDNESKNEIRLSKLMGVSPSLATELSGKQVIELKNVKLNKPNGISVVSVLSKKSGEIFHYLLGTGTNLYPGWLETYMDTITVTSEDSKINFSYAKVPEGEVKTSLKDYRIDITIQLSRELDDNETLTITAFGKTKTFNRQQLNENMYQLKLSDLMEIDADLADVKSGKDEIIFSTNDLKRNLGINAASILVKGEEVLSIQNSAWLSLFQPSFEAYINSIDLQSEDNIFTVSYTGNLDENVKAQLTGYYADAMIHIDRPLKDGETVKIKAFEKDITVTRDSFASIWSTSIRLSDLLDLEMSDAQLAVKQKGSFRIEVLENSLSEQLQIYVYPILVKGHDLEYLSKSTWMSLIPKGFNAFDASIDLISENQGQFVVRYNDGLSVIDKGYLAGLYADPLISIDRQLESGESFTITAYDKSAVITKEVLRQFADNRIGLTELLGVPLTDELLAANKKGDVIINITNVNLKTPSGISLYKGLLKSDGTRVYQSGAGIWINLLPDFMKAYENNLTISAEDNKFSVTYNKPLTDTVQTSLDGYYADTMVWLSRPLEAGETVMVEAHGVKKTIDSSTVTDNNGTQIRLSQLLGITLGANQLAANQTVGFEITVTDQSLKTDLSVSADAMLVKGDAYYCLNKGNSIWLKSLSSVFIDSYSNTIELSNDGTTMSISYNNGFTDDERVAYSDYTVDTVLSTDRELEDNETIILDVNDSKFILTNQNMSDSQIRLSQLLKEKVSAVLKDGIDVIKIESNTLSKQTLLSSNTQLVAPSGEEIYLGKTMSLDIVPISVKEFFKTVSSNFVDNKSVHYHYNKHELTNDVVSGLTGYYLDYQINFSRELVEGEEVTVNIGEESYTFEKTKIADLQLKLSELTDKSQLAVDKDGDEIITFSSATITDRLTFSLIPILEKDGINPYLHNNSYAITLYPLWFDTYTQALNFSATTEDNSFTISYNNEMIEGFKEYSDNYYSELVIDLERPLAENEKILVSAYGKEGWITPNSEYLDSDPRMFRLSKIIGLSEAQLVANQKDTQQISFIKSDLNSQIMYSLQAALVKDDVCEFLGAGIGGLMIRSDGVNAYLKSLITTTPNNRLNIFYHGNLTTDEQADLDGLYSDVLLTFNRVLSEDEEVTITSETKEYRIKGSELEVSGDNTILLSNLLGKPIADMKLAIANSGEEIYNYQEQALDGSLEISCFPVIVDADKKIVFSSNTGVTWNLYPLNFTE